MKGRVARLAASALLCAGCVVVPVPERTPELTAHRGAIAPQDVATLRRDGATREDVLLRLGEPDLVDDDGRKFTYVWDVVVAEEVWMFGNAQSSTMTARRSLVLGFDESGRLVSAPEIQCR